MKAKVVLKLPAGLAGLGLPLQVECEGETVAETLADSVAREPMLKSRIFREDGRVLMGVFLNGQNVRRSGGFETPLSNGDEIRLLAPIAGG